MKTHLVRIGNSRGIRLPKPLIDQVGLTDEVEIRVEGNAIIIERASSREGWAEAAQRMHAHGEDELLDPIVPTEFDDNEWEW